MELLLAIFLKLIAPGMIGGFTYPLYLYLGGESTDIYKVLAYGIFGGIIGYVGYYVMLGFWVNIENNIPSAHEMKPDVLRIGTIGIGFFAKNIVDLASKRVKKGQ